MDYFPAFLNLRGRSCLVVGGGDIALRKVRLLNRAGAGITIVAPEFSEALTGFSGDNGHKLVARPFRPSDVLGHWLVVSATGVPSVERSVYENATDAGIFCNGVDDIENCSFITPAIVDRSPIVVAISSGGAAPCSCPKNTRTDRTVVAGGIVEACSPRAQLACAR